MIVIRYLYSSLMGESSVLNNRKHQHDLRDIYRINTHYSQAQTKHIHQDRPHSKPQKNSFKE